MEKISEYKHGRVPRALREKQILDIAEQQFIEFGYEQTTVESVRLAAGVSRPMIYDYYGSKDCLYLACVKRARKEYEALLTQIWQQPGLPEELITESAKLYFSIVEKDPKRWQVLFGGTSVPMFGQLGDKLRELREGTIKIMVELLKLHVLDEDYERLDAFAHIIFAVGEHLGQWWLNNPTIPKERVIDHHVAFITNGLNSLQRKEFL